MSDEIYARLAIAADNAIMELVADRDAAIEAFGAEGLFDARCAKFVRTAGDISGEALFRWTSARELHPFKGDEWPKISADFRLLFEGFAAVVKALAPILDPPKPAAGAVIWPSVPKVDVEDTIFRKYGSPGQRAHHSLDPSSPKSTQGLTITPNAPSPVAAPAAEARAPDPTPIVIGRDALTRFEKGAPPTQAEFMAMTPEQRRPYAALFGMPGDGEGELETVDPAPPAEALAPMAIEAEVGGEKIAGTVAIGKTRRGAKA